MELYKIRAYDKDTLKQILNAWVDGSNRVLNKLVSDKQKQMYIGI